MVTAAKERPSKPVTGDKLPALWPPFLKSYFTGVFNGEVPKFSRDQISTAVHDQFAAVTPLTPLQPGEEAGLVNYTVNTFSDTLMRRDWTTRAGAVIHRPPDEDITRSRYPGQHRIYTGTHVNPEFDATMTPSDKEEVFTNPDIYTDLVQFNRTLLTAVRPDTAESFVETLVKVLSDSPGRLTVFS